MVGMKIGVVSKGAHCKTHTAALKSLGYKVVELGSSPTCVPKSVDLIVLRTASCSHRGDAVARSWARKTGKPLVVENGLSGIRRELNRLQGGPIMLKPIREVAEMEMDYHLQCPGGGIEGGFGSFSYPPPDESQLATEIADTWAWKKYMTSRRFKSLEKEYPEALGLVNATDPKVLERFRKSMMKSGVASPRTVKALYGDPTLFVGRPALFALVYLLCIPPNSSYHAGRTSPPNGDFSRTMMRQEYLKLTGKIMGNDIPPSVSWWARRDGQHATSGALVSELIPELESAVVADIQETPTETPGTSLESRIVDLEDMLLEAMTNIAELMEAMTNIAELKVNSVPEQDTVLSVLQTLKDIGAKVTITLD